MNDGARLWIFTLAACVILVLAKPFIINREIARTRKDAINAAENVVAFPSAGAS
jgi:hypothetical protein